MEVRDAEIAAFEFLRERGASPRLMQHASFVREAAEGIIGALEALGVPIAVETVRLGAILHDAGKTIHPEELDSPGVRHEAAGRDLLLSAGYPREAARMCASHGQWRTMECSLEELVVALADTLWKGKREDELEAAVVERAARLLGRERWEVFRDLDSCFEAVAAGGHERLLRSRRAER